MEKEKPMAEILDDARVSDNLSELEYGSLNFRGIIPGAKSDEVSEEPGFREVTSGQAPKGSLYDLKEIRKVQDSSLKKYKEDPIYGGIIDAFSFFIIGKGMDIEAVDESEEVTQLINDFIRENRMDGLDREIVMKGLKCGELFIRFFTTAGELTARIPRIRVLNYWDITNIKYDQRGNPVAYGRSYTEDGSYDIKTEMIPADQILHIKFCDTDGKRGVPPFTNIIRECAYYDDWRFNRIVLNRLKTCYYLEEIVKGSPANVTSVDNATPDANKVTKSGQVIKRMPKPGSKITHNESVEYKWLTPTVNADDAKEDGRLIRLAICAGAQCPEFILGDSSQSNYASTLVSQNPFVRKIEWFQDFYSRYFMDIYAWVIKYGLANNFLPSKSKETKVKEKAYKVGLMRKIKVMFTEAEQLDKMGNVVTQKEVPTKTEVMIQWPNLIAANLLQDTQAYQIQQSMGVVDDSTIAGKLGYDFDEEKMKMKRNEKKYGKDEADNEMDAGTKKRDQEIDKGDDDESEADPKDKSGFKN